MKSSLSCMTKILVSDHAWSPSSLMELFLFTHTCGTAPSISREVVLGSEAQRCAGELAVFSSDIGRVVEAGGNLTSCWSTDIGSAMTSMRTKSMVYILQVTCCGQVIPICKQRAFRRMQRLQCDRVAEGLCRDLSTSHVVELSLSSGLSHV